MPCKDVLVVVADADSMMPRLAPVLTLASRLGARVTGLFASGNPISPAYGDVSGWMQVIDAYMAGRRGAGSAAEGAFRELLARHRIEGDWIYRETDLTHAAIAAGRLYDLVVLGQPDPDRPGLDDPGFRPEEVVLAVGRPALLLPYAGMPAEIGGRILVAWNGTREATRALHDSMFLIESATAVTVVEIDPPSSAPAAGRLSAEGVAAFLARRGIAADSETQVSGDGVSVPDMLLSRAADLGAQLLVMGAYGHSRLREYVLGGVSRSVFHQMTVPILMAH